MIEVVLNATSSEMMDSWAAASPELDLVRTEPMNQISNDYADFPGTPTIPLIDLTDMTVLDRDCFYATSSYQGATTWRACIENFL